MMNNNHKNSGCGKGSELVSYIYGEASAAENKVFEIHLETCSICADELETFSGVHFSINDWKLKDFANLQTPVIALPYPTAPVKQEVSGVDGSWLLGLRRLFSPKLSLAAASMAVLAICVGIVLYVSNSREADYIVEKNKNTKIQVSPTVEKSTEVSNSNSKQNNLPDPESKPLDKPQPQLAVETDAKNNRTRKTTNTQRRTEKVETTNLPQTNDAKRNDKKKNEIPPKIFDEEEEDDTLRLAEMLEEIDTIE